MNVRFPRFQNRARRARNRVVAVGVVAAFAAASFIGSAANAVDPPTTTKPKQCTSLDVLIYATCAVVAGLVKEANPADLTPKDMQLAAPGRAIASTVTHPSEVNRWRPNPQAWIDAKTRLAGSTEITTKEVSATSRWAPKLLKGAGVAGWLSVGAEVAFTVRDNTLYTMLGTNTAVEDSFCAREGSVALDFLGGLAGANCPEWRLDKDFVQLVGDMSWVVTGSAGGLSYLRTDTHTYGHMWCYSGALTALPAGYNLVTRTKTGWSTSNAWSKSTDTGCVGLYFQHGTSHGNISPELAVRNQSTSHILERMTARQAASDAEWLTEVKCTDGTVRRAVSDAYQQEKLGAVARPAEVQLDGCKPVSVGLGAQPKGTGTTSNSPWKPAPPPGQAPNKTGTTTAIPHTEPTPEVKEWMQNFPQCWDGSCRLTLKKTTTGTTEVDCFTLPAECVNWHEESTTDPTKYKCYYAGVERPLADCLVYTRVFDKTNVQQGTGYSDPATGGNPTTGTGTTVTTNPGAALVAMNSPVANPASDRKCWPQGWGLFNPFEWVFQPVKCALEWAFVPRDSKVAGIQNSVRLAATNSKPAEVVQSLAVWPEFLPSGAECRGPQVSLSLPFNVSYNGYPASACQTPMSTAAEVSRAFLAFIFGAAGFFAITRYAGRIFGYEGYGSIRAIQQASQ